MRPPESLPVVTRGPGRRRRRALATPRVAREDAFKRFPRIFPPGRGPRIPLPARRRGSPSALSQRRPSSVPLAERDPTYASHSVVSPSIIIYIIGRNVGKDVGQEPAALSPLPARTEPVSIPIPAPRLRERPTSGSIYCLMEPKMRDIVFPSLQPANKQTERGLHLAARPGLAKPTQSLC